MNLEGVKEKRKIRQISDFLCQEMLYDYVSGKLDSSRQQAVEEHLKKNQALNSALNNLKFSLKYCDQLSEAQISEDFLEMVEQNASSQILTLAAKLKWQNLPEQMRWALQAIALSITAGLLIYITPWQSIKNMIPAKVEYEKIKTQPVVTPQEALNTNLVQNQPVEKVEPLLTNTVQNQKPDLKPLEPVAEPKKEEKTEVATDSSNVKVIDLKAETTKEVKKTVVQGTQAQFKGELYRAFMSHEDVNKVTPEIVEKLLAMGAEKAGEVQLGWRKVDGSYFHLTLDENKYNELLTYLQTFSPVRIYKDPHWRVMPAGKIRIILWIEDKKIAK